MIHITIELWPWGDASRKRHLGTIDIANDGTGSEMSGNYKARFAKRGRPDSTWRTGIVMNFPRKRLGVYDLLLRALIAVVGSRNKRFVDELRGQQSALSKFVHSSDEERALLGQSLPRKAIDLQKQKLQRVAP